VKLPHAIEVFLLSKEIAGFSPNTLRNYRLTLGRLSDFLASEDPELDAVTADDLRGFLHHLQTTPPETTLLIPREIKPLGPKSIRNVHATLSSLWGWAVDEGYVEENVAQSIEPPNPKRTVIEPFDEDEIRKLLQTAGNGAETTLRLRDKAILLFLLDTGVRASELCNLTIADMDIKEGSAVVRGKGRLDSGQGKERIVMFGSGTRTAAPRSGYYRLASRGFATAFAPASA
jgi:site-specific recombinase XerD